VSVTDEGGDMADGPTRTDKARGDFESFDAFVEQCMSEYDLNGYTAAPWNATKQFPHTLPKE
jgi:hypothetical protein